MAHLERSAKIMKLVVVLAVTFCALFGCSKSTISQSELYRAIARDLNVPQDEVGKSRLYAELRTAARLDDRFTPMSYDLFPVPLLAGREADFYDSVVFVRKVMFTGPEHEVFVLEEEIYGYVGATNPFTLRRSVFDMRARKFVFEEFLSDVRRK
jgi:hypothetical protein